MKIAIRMIRDDDARRYLEVHHAAVRHIAAQDYPEQVVENWAPLPITEESISEFRKNPNTRYALWRDQMASSLG